jgi:predicted TPR repeat methyltransferase
MSMQEPNSHGATVAMPIAQGMQQAAMAYGRGELAEAERWCRQVLAAREDYIDALNLLGIIAAQTQRLEEAAHLLGSVVHANPGLATAHNNYGNVLKDLKRFHAALDSYERALKIKPDYAEALNNRGNALQELKRLDEALASYDQALALRPDYAEALNNRGHVLKELKRLDQALSSYDQALALRPNHSETLHYRGSALQELGRLDEALASYDHALALGRNRPGTHHNRGDALLGLKRLDEAVAAYEQALALRPDYAEALNNRGNALQELKRFDEAIASYDRALSLRPESAEALNNRGNALKADRRLDEALASYDQALALRPDYAEAHYNRGNALQELQRLDEALACYDQALAFNPGVFGDFGAFESLGSLLYQLGRVDQAAGVYRKWLEAQPANAIAQHLYAAASSDKVPQRASAQYVTTLFDRFADSFDLTLQRLDYAGPRLMYEALLQTVDCAPGGLAILDAGCGTGLCGVLLRSTAKFLAGVDLSSQMLARARALNLYDELFEAELCGFMASRPEEFDAVICADTLVYFGALEEPVMAARRCLRPRGVFAFTLEALPEESSTPFRINANGRYAHAGQYVRDTLESSGFSAVQCRSVVARKEFGNDVTGYLVTCRV